MDKNYWETRWQMGQTGWDLGIASPPIVEYAQQIDPCLRAELKLLIPGCGNGYEAIKLVELGFQNITMLDISPSAVANMQQRVHQNFGSKKVIEMVCGDFFEHSGSYDLIFEQTFFCALNPAMRKNYVEKMSDLLTPFGKLVGVLFNRDFDGGPPFGGTIDEYQQLFAPFFVLKKLETCQNSIAPRAGSEVFIIFQKMK